MIYKLLPYWILQEIRTRLMPKGKSLKQLYTEKPPEFLEGKLKYDEWSDSVDLGFYEHILLTEKYDNVIEIGTWDGRFIERLAGKFPKINFLGNDVNNFVEKLNDKHKHTNLIFQKREIKDIPKLDGKTLIITRSVMNSLDTEYLLTLLDKCKEYKYDVAMIENSRYQRPKKSVIGYVGEGKVKHWSHPIKKYLLERGFNLKFYDDTLYIVRFNGCYHIFAYAMMQ